MLLERHLADNRVAQTGFSWASLSARVVEKCLGVFVRFHSTADAVSYSHSQRRPTCPRAPGLIRQRSRPTSVQVPEFIQGHTIESRESLSDSRRRSACVPLGFCLSHVPQYTSQSHSKVEAGLSVSSFAWLTTTLRSPKEAVRKICALPLSCPT